MIQCYRFTCKNISFPCLRTNIHIPKRYQSSSDYENRNSITMAWFRDVVIGTKLCPFAPPLLQTPSLLRIVSSTTANPDEAIVELGTEIQKLMKGNSLHETTLITYGMTSWTTNFQDFVRLSWQMQEQAVGETHVSDVQLVLFHPHATHQTYADHGDEPNPADYTIRSPFPTLHILRQMDVLRAVQSSYPDLESLPARNQQRMIQQGIKICQERLQNCFHVTK
jgi:uncharacterized protein